MEIRQNNSKSLAERIKSRMPYIMIFLGVLGPGIITAIVDNDAGGITTYSLAGSNFGYALLWVMIPVVILLIIVQEMCARLGVVTGKGLADLIRENFSIKTTFIIMILLILVNIANTISEFAGIAAAGEIFGVSRYIALPIAGIFVWWLVLKGSYKSVEKVFFMSCIFFISYIIAGFMTHPPWGAVSKEIIRPSFTFEKTYLIMIIGLIGTSISPWMQFYQQASIVEKGVKKKDYIYSKIDVIIGCIVAMVIAFFIVVATSATLFKSGIRIDTASDAARALIPLAGKYAGYLFAFGLLNASLFAASVLPLSTAYSVSEAFGWELGVNRKYGEAKQFYLLYGGMIVAGVLFVFIPNISLISLMYFSQVLNGILLPIIIIFMLKLINNKDLVGEYKNSRLYNIVAWSASIVIMAVAVVALFSVFI